MLEGVDLIPERCPHRWASPGAAGDRKRCVGLADEPHSLHWWDPEEQALWTRLIQERFVGAAGR